MLSEDRLCYGALSPVRGAEALCTMQPCVSVCISVCDAGGLGLTADVQPDGSSQLSFIKNSRLPLILKNKRVFERPSLSYTAPSPDLRDGTMCWQFCVAIP